MQKNMKKNKADFDPLVVFWDCFGNIANDGSGSHLDVVFVVLLPNLEKSTACDHWEYRLFLHAALLALLGPTCTWTFFTFLCNQCSTTTPKLQTWDVEHLNTMLCENSRETEVISKWLWISSCLLGPQQGTITSSDRKLPRQLVECATSQNVTNTRDNQSEYITHHHSSSLIITPEIPNSVTSLQLP